MPLRDSYDIVIIGGGGHGLACAYYLARNWGVTKVAVLEKGWLASGNTARNTAIIRSNYLTPEGTRFYQASVELFEDLSRALDLNLFYSVLGGPDRSDPQSRGVGENRSAGKTDTAFKILYIDRFGDEPCDPFILQSCRKAADRLADLGHIVESGVLPFDLAAISGFWGTIAQVGLARMRRAIPRMRERAGPQYQAMADLGDAVSAADFLAGLEGVRTLRSAVSQAFANWDLIMTPACAAMPWVAENPFPEEIDRRAVGPRGHAIYTGWVNASGHPAVALPADPAPDGLPIGFQLIGDLAAEDLLLEIAAAYEETREGDVLWPDIALGDG